MGSGVRWGGREALGDGKIFNLGHPMNSHESHTVANDKLVGHVDSESKSRPPLPNWRLPRVPLYQP